MLKELNSIIKINGKLFVLINGKKAKVYILINNQKMKIKKQKRKMK